MPKTLSTSFTLSDAALRSVIGEIQGGQVDRVLNIAGLVIGTTSKKAVKLTNVTHAFVNGVLLKLAAATETALAGTTVNAKFAVYCLLVDSAGALSIVKSADADSRAAIIFPTITANTAMVGFVLVNPTGTGNFVGGTTDLDDATVIPNAEYVDAINGFNPNLLAL